jgi:hypothetical protein
MGDVLCSEGINPLLELAFQLNNNHLENRDASLFRLRQSRSAFAAQARSRPIAHVGIHRIARNNRVRTTALLAVERAIFET